MDNHFILEDRLQKIRQIYKEYNLEDNASVSFSGGRDSLVASKLLDMAIPSNKIPRIFVNTGLEFVETVAFVKRCQKVDNRIQIITPKYSAKTCFTEYGYPFKSKYHSHLLHLYQRQPTAESALKYANRGDHSQWACPDKLRYQFSPDFQLKVSDKCCYKMKKEPLAKWAKENNRSIAITGMRRAEKGLRNDLPCLSFQNEKLKLFSPLAPLTDEFVFWFCETYHIQCSLLYYPPYNFKRTGCVGCPFNTELHENLQTLKELCPIDYRRAVNLFGAVYEEYSRIGYRRFTPEEGKLYYAERT